MWVFVCFFAYFDFLLSRFSILWAEIYVKIKKLFGHYFIKLFSFCLSLSILPFFDSSCTYVAQYGFTNYGVSILFFSVFFPSVCFILYSLYWTIFKDIDTFFWSVWSSIELIYCTFHSKYCIIWLEISFKYISFSSLMKFITYSLQPIIFSIKKIFFSQILHLYYHWTFWFTIFFSWLWSYFLIFSHV